jgi:hypothetical protein
MLLLLLWESGSPEASTDPNSTGLESSPDYEYVGLYPKVHPFLSSPLFGLLLDNVEQGSPHYDNNFCKANEQETREKAANARSVPIPVMDLIFGDGGPLVEIWGKAEMRE